MSRLLPWSLGALLGLAGCTVPSLEELQGERTVTVEVSFNFKAGCISVQARDESSREKSTVHTVEVLDRVASDRKVTVDVFRQADWSNTLELTTRAHEKDCAGKPVAEDKQTVRFERAGVAPRQISLSATDADGDGYVPLGAGGSDCDDTAGTGSASFPGATETCDFRDNDCDSDVDEGLPRVEVFRDEDGDGVGVATPTLTCVPPAGYADRGGDCADNDGARTPGKPEVCDEKDNNCDTVVDEGSDKRWYLDGDNDGAQAQASLVTQCDSPGAGYAHRNNQPFDCADDDVERTPGKTELCDDKDNNCSGVADEPFTNKGNPCNNGICSGNFVCNAAKTATECNVVAPLSHYPDADGDGEGQAGSTAAQVCALTAPAGRAANATDCDDVDPSARRNGVEVCDAVDNNCAGGVDEGLACGGSLRLISDPARGGSSHDWRAVALGSGGLPVWVAGLGGKLIVRRTAGGAFQSHGFNETPANTTNCGNFDWFAAWVRPSDGSVFLAGSGGRVAQHTGTACINQTNAGSARLTGMVGFETGGVTRLYLVNVDGDLLTWVPGSTPALEQTTSSTYNSIHALRSDLLLVGVRGSDGNQRITSYVNGNLGANAAHTLSAARAGGVLAVWMGASNLAYAVGEGGTVWKWDGTTSWTQQLPAPASGGADLTGVVALPNGDAYVVDSSINGQLHRRTPHGWAAGPKLPAPASEPLRGIAMSSAGDFWVVGDNGYIFHYPEP